MRTKKQDELINTFLDGINDDLRPIYYEIVNCLSKNGYNPQKERSNISFKHDLHNKQMAKMGMKKGKNKQENPFFALRFSACNGYSHKFEEIVSSAIIKYPTRASRCIGGNCNFCAGEPDSHIYSFVLPDGEKKTHCGAYVLEIPDICKEDLDEITELIREEHIYLMKNQVGIETNF